LIGSVGVPADKSIAHRAIILGSFAKGETRLRNFFPGADNLATVEACRMLGVEIGLEGSEGRIRGVGWEGIGEPAGVIDCGNSGTTMRLIAGVLAARPFSARLDGDSSLRRRPMARVVEPLSRMGARIEALGEGGRPPLVIHGAPLRGCHHELKIASAQVKSAILLAGLQAKGLTVVEEPAKSRDHTERMLSAFGARVAVEGRKVEIFGPQELEGTEVELVGDLSSAAFLIVAAALVPGSDLRVERVGLNPTRTGLLDLLAEMGGDLSLVRQGEVAGEPVGMVEVRSSELKGIEVGGERLLRAIDEFPILCVAASLAEGDTRITGAGELRVKESDRIAAMACELRKLGARVEELSDGLVIRGGERLRGARLESHGDHRIAMALAVAGLVARGETEVEGAEVVAVSFPGFFECLNLLSGGAVEVA